MPQYVLAIDEGSTGVRALLFDHESQVRGSAYEEIPSVFPAPGRFEQDPLAIWDATLRVARQALQQANVGRGRVAGLGITNQRSTTVVWERVSGRPVHPAISWQDNRTAERVEELQTRGVWGSAMASATKIEWLLGHIDRGVDRAAAGELCFGTIDSWLLWKLTGGVVHMTDHSNASSTGLYDFFGGGWDGSILDMLGIPESLMPSIRESSEVYGETDPTLLGEAIPVAAVAGDQQAALFGELGVERGAVKITYGTSGIIDLNLGDQPVLPANGTYPLILWSFRGERPFGLEGTVITAGGAVQWLRDSLGLFGDPAESGALAESVVDSAGVWFVPALQGMGTPHMDPQARGVIGGLSRAAGRAHVVRAVLEGIAFRSREALEAVVETAAVPCPAVLRADGGAAANDFLLQSLANILGRPVERPATVQASALGVAYLAGIATDVWRGVDEVRQAWRSGGVFHPRWSADERDERFQRWRSCVGAASLRGA